MAVTPTTLEHIKLLFNSPDVYRMTSPRGRVFIIHNDEFDNPVNDDQDCLDDREGSEFDVAKLPELFSALDFVVVVHNNLSAKRILEELDRETVRPEHKEYGMFIMIVMSHGDHGVIHGSDARKVAIDDMKRRLSVKNFPAMADKPKLLVIQACAGGSVKLTSLVKLRHLETISTPGSCYTVTLGPDSQVIHGGYHYDSLNGTRDGLSINCIRAAPDNQLIMLEDNYRTDTKHIVTYQLNQKPTLMRKLFSKVTSNSAYKKTNKIQVQHNADISQFTKIDDLLIQTGGDSGKLYFYRYPTGDLIREVTHPDMKYPHGICHDANSNIYVTDLFSRSIFNVTLNNDGSPTVTKLSCDIAEPTGITLRDGLLAVLSRFELVHELHIITTRGETVTIIKLPECSGFYDISDLSINTRGVVAIANCNKGIQLYELE